MKLRTLCAAVIVTLLPTFISPPAIAAGPLVDPSDDVMCLLYYKFAKLDPPLDDFATAVVAQQNTNEFNKQQAIDTEKTKLQALVASLAEVTTIRTNIDMQMGEYDSDRGEYDLTGFSPDQFLQFFCFHKQAVRLRFDNAEDAQAWVLDPKAAEAALNKNGGDRDVLATATVELTGIDSTSPGDPPMIVGNVTDVSLSGEFNHAKLGHYAVSAK